MRAIVAPALRTVLGLTVVTAPTHQQRWRAGDQSGFRPQPWRAWALGILELVSQQTSSSPMRYSLRELEALIREEWCADTAWSPDAWTTANPAAGQCFSSSYVLATLLGGEIVHAEILPHTQPKQRHAWVRLASGLELDMTADQFPAGQRLLPCELPPELVWSFGGRQAELLLQRVRARLAQGNPAATLVVTA